MKNRATYSALSFNKAFIVGIIAAFFIHVAFFFNPFFSESPEKPLEQTMDPVIRAERITLVPPETPKVVRKVVRAKIIPKVVENPVEEKEPLPEPEMEISSGAETVAVADPIENPPPQPKPVVQTKPKPSADSVKKVMRTYLGTLKRQLEKEKAYPETARRLKQEGSVRIRFTIWADGKIGDVEISESSRYSALDKSARETVERMGRFQPIPAILEKESWRIEIPIQFKLKAGRNE